MSALEDLTVETDKVVVSINAAIAVLGSPGDAAQLADLTAKLAAAQTALAAAVAAKSS